MRFPLSTAALVAVAALTLTGCATAIAGSPIAGVNPQEAIENPFLDGADLALPDGVDGVPGLGDLFSGEDGMPDLGELFGGLSGEDGMPDLGELFGELSGEDGMPDLGELFGELSGEDGMPDLSELFGGLSGQDGMPDFGEMLGGIAGSVGALGVDEACSTGLATTASVMGLFMTPAMGGTITQDQVDRAFAQVAQAPPEMAGNLGVLLDAAQRMVDKPAAEARAILDEPTVDAAMDDIDQHFNEVCGGE